jgi:hypothetical protein
MRKRDELAANAIRQFRSTRRKHVEVVDFGNYKPATIVRYLRSYLKEHPEIPPIRVVHLGTRSSNERIFLGRS